MDQENEAKHTEDSTESIGTLMKLVKDQVHKLLFCDKLFMCLSFVEKHPEYYDKVGLFWCRDDRSFACQSKILGAFLNIKPNTINTNLRSHGFKLESFSSDDLPIGINGQPEPRCWKKHRNDSYPFYRKMDPKLARQIRCFDNKNAVQIIPNQLINTNDNSSICYEKLIPPPIYNINNNHINNVNNADSIQHPTLVPITPSIKINDNSNRQPHLGKIPKKIPPQIRQKVMKSSDKNHTLSLMPSLPSIPSIHI